MDFETEMSIEKGNNRLKDLESETRLTRKSRFCWTLGFFGAIIIGLLVFFLTNSTGTIAMLLVIFLVTLIYTTIGEIVTRTFLTFYLRSILIFPFGSIFAYVLNYFARKYTYVVDDPYGINYTILLFAILFVVCGLGVVFATVISRLIYGYEALSKEPVILSYSINSNKERVSETLKGFLSSLNITNTTIPSTTIAGKSQQFLKFDHNRNQYRLFTYPIDKDGHTEIDLVVLSWKSETIIEPNKEDLEIFSGYLRSYLDREKKEKNLGEWTLQFKPVNAEASKLQVLADLTSAFKIRERLALRGFLTQRIVLGFKAHKTRIVDIILAVLAILIGEFILRYVLHWV